jgi:hypothetical protein
MRKVRITNIEDPDRKPHADIVVHRFGDVQETVKPGRATEVEIDGEHDVIVIADRILVSPQPDPAPPLTAEQQAEMVEHNRRVDLWMQHGIRMGFPEVPEAWFPPLDPDGKPAEDKAPSDPLDHDGNGRKGGSKPKAKRK